MNITSTALNKTKAPSRFFRSMRLDTDVWQSDLLEGYAVTPHVRQVLQSILTGLRGTERACTLTGPYGGGKTAFAVFLGQLLCAGSNGTALKLLSRTDPTLALTVREVLSGRLFVPVPITARRAPLERCLVEGVAAALTLLPASQELDVLRPTVAGLLESAAIDTRDAVKSVRSLHRLSCEMGHAGVLIVIDELGKGLEYCSMSQCADVYLLQELAEQCSRSGDHPMMLIGVLHQPFERYGEFLDSSGQREWAKVQGRFYDLAFLEPFEEQIRLAAKATHSLFDDKYPFDDVQGIARAMVETRHCPPSLRAEEFISLCQSARPLHPTVLAAMPHVFRRLGQNERSLYAFLGSGEPCSVRSTLGQGGKTTIRLADLFDYLAVNMGSSLRRQLATRRRWLEVSDALESCHDLTPLETAVLKTIGLVNVLGDVGNLSTDSNLIGLAVFDRPDAPGLGPVLKGLADRSLIVYRRFTSSYRVWEGSDIDIEERLQEGRAVTSGEALPRTLDKYLPTRHFIPRRHVHQVGCLRFFSTVYLGSPRAPGDIDRPDGADGVVVCCLPATPGQEGGFLRWAQRLGSEESRDLLIVIPHEVTGLRELAAELRALRWVRQNTPQLRDDRVARRELSDRENAIEEAITGTIDRLFDPRPAPLGSRASWWYQGQKAGLDTPRGIARLLSQVMDDLYPLSPEVQNELINRRSLSSAAAKARRNLLEAMITHRTDEVLAIKGFPPERAMYETVLMTTGLHRQMPDGGWGFHAPHRQHSGNLDPAWRELERVVYSESPEPWRVDGLQDRLGAPPYGVMPGVFPVLLCAFILASWDEISVYREGAFVPEMSITDLEVLMKRPDHFAIKGIRVSGIRRVHLDCLAGSFGCEATVVGVARALMQRVREFPKHAWRTRHLPAEVLALRDALENAASPEALLLRDLPGVFGEEPLLETEGSDQAARLLVAKLNTALTTWASVTDLRVEEAWRALMESCQLEANSGLVQLRRLAPELRGQSLPPMLAPVLSRLASDVSESDKRAIEDVLTLVTGRHPSSWLDSDIERFPVLARSFGDQFVQLLSANFALSPADEQRSVELTVTFRKHIPHGTPPYVIKRALSKLLREVH
jgi:hypothetical protein